MRTWLVDVIDNVNDRQWHYTLAAPDAWTAKTAGLNKAGISEGRGVEVFVTKA